MFLGSAARIKRYPRSVSDEQLDRTDYDSVYAAMSELEQRGWRKATLNERVAAYEALVDEVVFRGWVMTFGPTRTRA